VDERDVERHIRPQPLVRREDVFGPEPSRSRDVGAIGDGRKKNSPGYEDIVSFLWVEFLSMEN
jgi:hypothetical protein